MEKLIRSFKGEVRTETASDGRTFIIGRAASYSVRSENLGWPDLPLYEMLQPGAFDDTDVSDCIHAVDHDATRLLGKVASHTTKVIVDGGGVRYKTAVPDCSYARDLVELINRGDAAYSSFAFTLPDDGSGEIWSEIADPKKPELKCVLRTITRVEKLWDVSTLTGFPPAYPKTGAALSDRALSALPPELRSLILSRAAADDQEDDDEPCSCDCESCLVDGDCSGCSQEDCLDAACLREGCPMQDGSRAGRGVAELEMLSNELEFEEMDL